LRFESSIEYIRLYKTINPGKQLTLAVSLLKVQSNRVLDDLAEMFIKHMSIIHQIWHGCVGGLTFTQSVVRR
jgi:hypothetical protein